MNITLKNLQEYQKFYIDMFVQYRKLFQVFKNQIKENFLHIAKLLVYYNKYEGGFLNRVTFAKTFSSITLYMFKIIIKKQKDVTHII